MADDGASDAGSVPLDAPLKGQGSTWAGLALAVTGPVVASQSLASYEVGCFCYGRVVAGLLGGTTMMVSGAVMTVRGPRTMISDLNARGVYVDDTAGKVANVGLWVSLGSIVPYILSDSTDSPGLAVAGTVLQVGGGAVALGATATQYTRNMKAYNQARGLAALPGHRVRVSVTPTPRGVLLSGTF